MGETMRFFALPPQTELRGRVCYLFIMDEEGRLACTDPVADLLDCIPYLTAETEFCAWLSIHFQVFAAVLDSVPSSACIPETYAAEESRLCLLALRSDLLRTGGVLFSRLAPETWQYLDFRTLLGMCYRWQGGLVSRAKELAYFDREFRYCSHCGQGLQRMAGEFGKHCSRCAMLYFPRQDPSVIALICWASEGKEWLLLAHNTRFHSQMYSLIAGFVDAGEDLEQALVREAWEEAGVKLVNLAYQSSQAWPQMHSLMAGFRASSLEPPPQSRPDGKEILSLLWLERSDLRDCLAEEFGKLYPLQQCREEYFYCGQGQEDALCLPGQGSIAHHLIAQWADSVAE